MGQAHQSYETGKKAYQHLPLLQGTLMQLTDPMYRTLREKNEGAFKKVFAARSLERNSSMGDAMATVAEMWVSLTIREGRSFIMMSGISTVHIVRATTHCLAQR